MFDEMLESSPCAGLVVDLHNTVLSANSAASELFGRPLAEMIGRPIKLDPDQRELVLDANNGRRRSLMVHTHEGSWNDQPARIFWFERDPDLLERRLQEAEVRTRIAEGEVERLRQRELRLAEKNRQAYERLAEYEARARHFEQLYQETVHHTIDEQTRQLAYEDALTGLPNLVILRHYLGVSLKQACDTKGSVALILLDIDRFRVINDVLGKDSGDELIRQVAQRLKNEIGDQDTLAHQTGDSFLVVLSASALGARPSLDMVRERAEDFCRRALNALNASLPVYGQPLHISASIGISLFPGTTDVDDMLHQASAALFEAKREGGGTFRFFTHDLRDQLENRRALTAQLRHAVEDAEFELHYQPIIQLRNGRLAGAEALLRWNHPMRGLLSPASFLELAEETNLIVPLGHWIISQACKMAAQLQSGFVSVNLSPRQLLHSGFVDHFMAEIERAGIPPRQMVVEVPEGLGTAQDGPLLETLHRLNGRGVLLALDDFGRGASSLKQLAEMPLKFLKIDRSVVERVPDESKALGITQAVMALAASMGTACLAEGIETLQQSRTLAGMGCEYAQGHFFSAALTADALSDCLTRRWPV
ncbi:MAG: putative bifunctional diguanylate cyclase/phosphodiesterase [Vulcanimicrobiota bacterium]